MGMVGVKDIKMRILRLYQHNVVKSSVKCDWYKAEIFGGNLGLTVIETFRDKRGLESCD